MLSPSPETLTPFFIAMATFGFTGSLHCAGMCGPLAAAACDGQNPIQNSGLYYSTRALSYAVLGGISGSIGALVFHDTLNVSSRTLAAVLGVCMVLYSSVEWMRAVSALRARSVFRPGAVVLKESGWIRRVWGIQSVLNHLQIQIHKLGLPKAVTLGVITALLPCGFLYAALAQSALLSQPLPAALAMAIFAVATSPALLLGSFGASFFRRTSSRYGGLIAASILLLASISVLYRGVAAPHHHEEGGGMMDHADHHHEE